MKKDYKFLILAVIIFAFILNPKISAASSLSFSLSSQQIRVGDTFTAQLNLESADKKINVAESSVYFNPKNLEVLDISTGGSIFNTWTRPPIFSNQTGRINFTGGTTASFSGNAGNIFTIVFLAKQAGQSTLNFDVSSALYLADGKGTKVSPHINNQSVLVLEPTQNYSPQNQWDKILAEDKVPPRDLKIVLGKDPSIFGGKYFISFSAIDDDSGINYYAVKEGSGDFLQTESPYLLKDQTLASVVTVKAVDKAGNSVLENLSVEQQSFWKLPYGVWLLIAAFILLLNAVWTIVVYKIKRNKKIS